ncbi:MAG TPA: DUF5701 family protein, partial [Actinomycetes bacterium]|nr:DUF5701 family protein [Actinomycetes bacterium]
MTEFERQLDVWISLNVPALIGVGDDDFRKRVEPLEALAASIATNHSGSDERAAFVLVPDLRGVDIEALVPKLILAGQTRPGKVDRNHGEEGLAPYLPLLELGIPDAPYLVVDVERGEEFCDVSPVDALAAIAERKRSPLTIQEGVALQLSHPAMLQPNKCFMLAGSRRGDKRVPALWISQRAPKLGWCWQGNPHSWLG